ncbi:MAG: tail fiber domain-containing protein, partial [Bacteroidota bacterium]
GLAFYIKPQDGSASTAPVEQMRLDYQGNLGIGTDSPTTTLALRDHSATANVGITQNQIAGLKSMELTTTDSNGSQATRLALSGGTNNADIAFYRGVRGAESASLFIRGSNGQVGIGHDSPSAGLHLKGTLLAENDHASFKMPAWSGASDSGTGPVAGTVVAGVVVGEAKGPQLRFQKSTSSAWVDVGQNKEDQFVVEMSDNVKLKINAAGRVDITNTLYVAGQRMIPFPISDERLKSAPTTLDGALEKVLSLEGVSYTWNELGINQIYGEPDPAITPEEAAKRTAEMEKPQIGLMAQAVEAVVPEVVQENHDGYKTVNYQHLVALLVEAIKEQNQKIEDLSSRLDAMS